ncbi:radical SAM protein, partial [bacterium]
MVILGKWQGQSLTISSKPNSLTVSLDGPTGARVFSYDLHGRMWTTMLRQVSYRRGLDGKVVAKWMTADNQRERRWLAREESDALLAEACALLDALCLATERGEVELSSPLPPVDLERLRKATAFSPDVAHADASRYQTIYRPVGILPPDQYMAVVLQLTEGCAFNTCTFCTFYRDRPFRIKKPEEFRQHI